jgi:soluble lytic murein transglycosylase
MEETAVMTARAIARSGGPDYLLEAEDGWTVDRTDPESNLHIGIHFLHYLMESQSHPLYAILGYNGGPTRIRRYLRAKGAAKLPPDIFMETLVLRETREYGKKVAGAAAIYASLYFGLKPEAILADIVGN